MTAQKRITAVTSPGSDVEIDLDDYRHYVRGFRMVGLDEAADFIERLVGEVEQLRLVRRPEGIPLAVCFCAQCGAKTDRRVFCDRVCQMRTVRRERREAAQP